MLRFRPLPFMTLFAVIALAILFALGRWQFDRYIEKTRLAEQPVAEMTIAAYEPVADGLQLVYGVRGGEPGWRVFAPVRDGDRIVFVDADFAPGPEAPAWRELRYPAALRFGAPILGAAIRPGAAPAFSTPPQPLQRLWFHIDLAAMGRAAGLANVAEYYLATAYIGVDGRAEPNPFAVAAGVDPLPPARHLGYALTWWGFAIVLMGVYFAYHISVGRLSFKPRAEAE
jgi:surfeit locus 1 family protein